MGWLGWSEDQLMRADVNSIELALEGRTELLQAIFGKADDPPPKGKEPKASLAQRFKAGVRRHNLRYEGKQKPGGLKTKRARDRK